MKKIITTLAVLWAAPTFAQVPATPAPNPPVDITGSVTTAVQQLDNSTNSSKLTEYRDLEDNFFFSNVAFSAKDRGTGWFFDFRGAHVTRDDRTIVAEAGRAAAWNVRMDWIGIPHNFSNKAATPYIQSAPGLFEVPSTVPITFKKLGTAAADIPGVVASDALIAAYQAAFLAPTPLATQTDKGRLAFAWSGSEAFSLGVAYDRRDKSGFKSTYGPIGDRPPRTLNIQLTEPVEYLTNDLTFSAEHKGRGYQVRAEYLFSDFANQVDTLQWQNVYTTAEPGAAFDVWDRRVATYGVRPLAPDNRYHNATVNAGIDMPLDSRLTGSVTYGRLEQDEQLLPYAFQVNAIANPTLPRASADASITTANFAADYVITPVRRLNIRAFVRRNDLNNETPSSQWQYVTSDTANLNGTVSYVNKRVSLPYAWDRQNAGADATWRLPARTTFTFGYEREAIERDFREANTTEDVLRASLRTRATRWLSVQGRFLQGLRDGGEYNNEVTHEGYWYSQSEANDFNNPLLTFDNHPDMRRFDVSDRQRRQFDVTLNLTPGDLVAISGFVRYRNDDFESDVTSTQPLLGTGLADETARTPGDQLGRLKDKRLRYGLDLFVQPTARASFNAFVNYDKGSTFDRSIEFNENNKGNPSAVLTAELGPWTRAGSQWTADFDDRTWSGGLGTMLQLIPDRLMLNVDYTLSLANVDLTYGGYGVTNWDGTPFALNQQFAFAARPPAITEDLHAVNVRFEVPLRALMLIVGYNYERYALDDWQQETDYPWVEQVGAETLLRDSSRSFQWGNRLFNLGTPLAPSYDAHIGFLGVRYRF